MSKCRYLLTDHICRLCTGRIVKARRHYRCVNCGTVWRGRKVEGLCMCGSQKMNGADMGLRCARNPNPTPENPGEIVIIFQTAEEAA